MCIRDRGRREKNPGSKWTEGRKKRHSEKMKEYWKKGKNKEERIEIGMWSLDGRYGEKINKLCKTLHTQKIISRMCPKRVCSGVLSDYVRTLRVASHLSLIHI